MFDGDRWREIVTTLRGNKLRAVLTCAGVFWGVFMLILMLGFGDFLEKTAKANMRGAATNAVYVWGQATSMPYKGNPPGRGITFRNDDIGSLIADSEEIEYLAPRNQLGGFRHGTQVVRGGKTGSFQIMGDYPAFRDIQPMDITAGRFINDLDIRDHRKVAIIGTRSVEQLFDDGSDPIGQYIQVEGVYFRVVGVLKPKGDANQSERLANSIFIPFTTFQQAFNFADRVSWFALTAKPDSSAIDVEKEVVALLKRRHTIAPDDSHAIGRWNSGKEFAKIAKLFTGISAIVWLVGTFTLLAGLLGVANIMLIAVRERTREIGLRKALGATPGSVVRMIMQEAMFLTSIAGYVGLLAGFGLMKVVGWGIEKANESGSSAQFGAPDLPLEIAGLAIVILTVGGVIAGIIPGLHAARIDPVRALHAE